MLPSVIFYTLFSHTCTYCTYTTNAHNRLTNKNPQFSYTNKMISFCNLYCLTTGQICTFCNCTCFQKTCTTYGSHLRKLSRAQTEVKTSSNGFVRVVVNLYLSTKSCLNLRQSPGLHGLWPWSPAPELRAAVPSRVSFSFTCGLMCELS